MEQEVTSENKTPTVAITGKIHKDYQPDTVILTYKMLCWLQIHLSAIKEGLILQVVKDFKADFNVGLKEAKHTVEIFKYWTND